MRKLLTLLVFMGMPATAQLAAPNEAGVAMGHLHLTVRDAEAHKKFWSTLGGTPVQNGRLQLIQFPGVFVMLRQAEPKGGTEGSTVNRVGFRVKNLKESLARWEAAGIKALPNATAKQAWLSAPDDIKIEITEDAALSTPIAGSQVVFSTVAPSEAQAWYAKTFGAKVPGVSLTFSETKDAPVGTRGRRSITSASK